MKRNKFSLSHYKLLSCNQGQLIPCGLTEVLPGDTVQQSTSALIRVQPLNAPVMHPVHARIHHWFVPHRLVWNDWENFITGGPDGLNASTFPTVTLASGAAVGSLSDYLGVPTGINGIEFSALPLRAYALVWNEFYRDQDLQTALTIDKTDGADTTTNQTLQNVCWQKDYFTTSRPWTQKGAEVTIPLGERAYVKGIAKNTTAFGGTATGYESDGTSVNWNDAKTIQGSAGADNTFYVQSHTVGGTKVPEIYADLSSATAASINDLREAFAFQRYEEARARYGSRYSEYLRYLGIRSSDARLQRPEYLGGGKQTIQFSEVLQTAPVYDSTEEEFVGDVGALKGHGIGAMRSNRYRRFFEEHGYVISMFSVQPITVYMQGLARTLNRRTKYDFFQKELQHIGQQEVLNKEVYAADSGPNDTFGYQDRYDEYRRTESTVAGEFRDTLKYWHMAREFSSDVTLNGDFVKSNPTNRIYADTSSHQLLVMVNHSIQARRMVAASGSSFIY